MRTLYLVILLLLATVSFAISCQEHKWVSGVDFAVNTVSISSKGRYIAAGAYGFWGQEGYVYLLDGTGNIIWKVNTAYSVYSVSISSDGSYIAVGVGKEGESEKRVPYESMHAHLERFPYSVVQSSN